MNRKDCGTVYTFNQDGRLEHADNISDRRNGQRAGGRGSLHCVIYRHFPAGSIVIAYNLFIRMGRLKI